MNNANITKLEKEYCTDTQYDDEKYKFLSIHDLKKSNSISSNRNSCIGSNNGESISDSQFNPEKFDCTNADSLKNLVYSTDSSSSELLNSLQISNDNIQQSQDISKSYWWDSLDCPRNESLNNITTEMSKNLEILEASGAPNWWNSEEHYVGDSAKSDNKNFADTLSPNKQGESTLDPNKIDENLIAPVLSHSNDLAKISVPLHEDENTDMSNISIKSPPQSYEEDPFLAKVSVRPKVNYGTINNGRSINSTKKCDDNFQRHKKTFKGTQNTVCAKTGSSDNSLITDNNSQTSSCDSQTYYYNSLETSMPYGSRSLNQDDFSIGQNPSRRGTGVSERVRHRSGSWTGVNESDEDVQQLSRGNGLENSSGISQNIDGSIAFRNPGRPHVNSYQHNLNSVSSGSTALPYNIDEESIKRRLKFFFMNPIDKYRARKNCPWKLLVQIVKVIICTVQLCMFAIQRYNHVSYLWDTKVSLSHLFIKGWDASREVVSYPPSTGPLAAYEIQEFYDFIDFSVKAFVDVEKTAVGAYKYQHKDDKISMPEICLSSYKTGAYNPSKNKRKLGNSIHTECYKIPTIVFNRTENFSLKKFLEKNNRSLNFDLLFECSYSFNLETIKLKSEYPFDSPECFLLETLIYFDNNDHDGQMLVDLDIVAKVLDCEETENVTKSDDSSTERSPLTTVVNVLTIFVCSLSFVLCFRALYRAQILRSAVNTCFLYRFKRKLNGWESFEFVNLWYILICVNDILIIIGSIIKMSLETQDYEGYLDKWNVCSLLLGTGNLLIWFGCLRYLGFFKTYNVLILTIKHCIPNIARYSICTLMVFAGYSFCGWLVLSPYHIKFRSLSTTFECLFSLINGDDMFATFTSTIGKDFIVWWFSRIYLYTFISLFIYVILSLVIAIITDAYYTLQRYYTEGFPETDLRRYAAESKADSSNGDFYDDDCLSKMAKYVCCCCPSGHRYSRTSGYERIPSNP